MSKQHPVSSALKVITIIDELQSVSFQQDMRPRDNRNKWLSIRCGNVAVSKVKVIQCYVLPTLHVKPLKPLTTSTYYWFIEEMGAVFDLSNYRISGHDTFYVPNFITVRWPSTVSLPKSRSSQVAPFTSVIVRRRTLFNTEGNSFLNVFDQWSLDAPPGIRSTRHLNTSGKS